MKPDIFVCSPLRGDFHMNKYRAKLFCRWVSLSGGNPIAPHLFYTEFLDDASEEERRLGIELGKERLTKCDAVWVFGFDKYEDCSEGMREEIDLANELGIEVRYIAQQVIDNILGLKAA